MKNMLSTVAALALVACGADPASPDTPSREAVSATLAKGGPAPSSTMDTTEDTHDAAAPAAPPSVVTVVPSFPNALDFEVRGDDVLVLFARRIDRCTPMGCTSEIREADMPPVGATQANASLALTSDGTILVAQKGTGKCAVGCTADDPTLPGLYAVGPSQRPRRLAPTMPLAFAKASRATDGWLLGRDDGFAVEQSYNNESFTMEASAFFFWTDNRVVPSSLSRGSNGPSRRASPFVFAETTTSARGIGFSNDATALVDVPSGVVEAPGFVAQAATATTNGPGHAILVAHGRDAADGIVTVFDAFTVGQKGADAPFPGIALTDDLVATTAHVAYYVPAAGALHACGSRALVTGTCCPVTIATGLDSIVRIRARGDQAYVLGLVGGLPRIVRVTF